MTILITNTGAAPSLIDAIKTISGEMDPLTNLGDGEPIQRIGGTLPAYSVAEAGDTIIEVFYDTQIDRTAVLGSPARIPVWPGRTVKIWRDAAATTTYFQDESFTSHWDIESAVDFTTSEPTGAIGETYLSTTAGNGSISTATAFQVDHIYRHTGSGWFEYPNRFGFIYANKADSTNRYWNVTWRFQPVGDSSFPQGLYLEFATSLDLVNFIVPALSTASSTATFITFNPLADNLTLKVSDEVRGYYIHNPSNQYSFDVIRPDDTVIISIPPRSTAQVERTAVVGSYVGSLVSQDSWIRTVDTQAEALATTYEPGTILNIGSGGTYLGTYINTSGADALWVNGPPWTSLGGVTNFVGLSDTPNDLTGLALQILRVNAAENAIEATQLAASIVAYDNAVSLIPGSPTTSQAAIEALKALIDNEPAQVAVADINARDLLLLPQDGDIVHVEDAQADPAVTGGWAKYQRIGGAWFKYLSLEELTSATAGLAANFDAADPLHSTTQTWAASELQEALGGKFEPIPAGGQLETFRRYFVAIGDTPILPVNPQVGDWIDIENSTAIRNGYNAVLSGGQVKLSTRDAYISGFFCPPGSNITFRFDGTGWTAATNASFRVNLNSALDDGYVLSQFHSYTVVATSDMEIFLPPFAFGTSRILLAPNSTANLTIRQNPSATVQQIKKEDSTVTDSIIITSDNAGEEWVIAGNTSENDYDIVRPWVVSSTRDVKWHVDIATGVPLVSRLNLYPDGSSLTSHTPPTHVEGGSYSIAIGDIANGSVTSEINYISNGVAGAGGAWIRQNTEQDTKILDNIQVGLRSSGTNAGSNISLTFVDNDGVDYPASAWAYSANLVQYTGGSAEIVTDRAQYSGTIGVGRNKSGPVKFYYTGKTPNGISEIRIDATVATTAQDVIVTYQGTNYNDSFAALADLNTPLPWTTIIEQEKATDQAAYIVELTEYTEGKIVSFREPDNTDADYGTLFNWQVKTGQTVLDTEVNDTSNEVELIAIKPKLERFGIGTVTPEGLVPDWMPSNVGGYAVGDRVVAPMPINADFISNDGAIANVNYIFEANTARPDTISAFDDTEADSGAWDIVGLFQIDGTDDRVLAGSGLMALDPLTTLSNSVNEFIHWTTTDNPQNVLFVFNPSFITVWKDYTGNNLVQPAALNDTFTIPANSQMWVHRVGNAIQITLESNEGGATGLRKEPVADITDLVAISNPTDATHQTVLDDGSGNRAEYVFNLGKVPAGTDVADGGATGAWVKIETFGTVASDEIGTLKQVPNVDETGAAMTNADYVAKGLLPLVNGYTLTGGATNNPKFALMYPTFVSGNDLLVPSTFDGDFVRNLGGNAAAFMVSQADEIQSHNHAGGKSVFGAEAAFGTTGNFGGGNNQTSNWDSASSTKPLTSSVGGAETRPENFAMQFCLVLDSYSRVLMVDAELVPLVALSELIFDGTTITNGTSQILTALNWQQVKDNYESITVSILFATSLYSNDFLIEDLVDGGTLQFAFNATTHITISSVDFVDGQFTIAYSGGGTATSVKIYGNKSQKTVIRPEDLITNDQASSGYIDLGTTRIQWSDEPSANGGTVVFNQPFASTPVITATSTQNSGHNMAVLTKSATQFTFDQWDVNNVQQNGTWNWIAIGVKP